MPKIDKPSPAQIFERELAKFAACFLRSAKGNLWRKYDDLILVVFRCRGSSKFVWSIGKIGKREIFAQLL
jgi:hypothetical protein